MQSAHQTNWPCRRLVACVLLAHVILLMPSILTNKHGWYSDVDFRPLTSAQYLLLTLYFGLGTGGLWNRFAISMLGMVFITLYVVWALAKPDDNGHSYRVAFQLWSILLMLPMLAIGIVLLPFRALVGQIQRSTSTNSTHRFRILDLLGITLVVALAMMWVNLFRAASDVPIDDISIGHWSKNTVLYTIELLAAAICVLGLRFRLISLVVLVALVASQYIDVLIISPSAWIYDVYRWLIVLLTLLAFRSAGFRLTNSVFSIRQKSHSLPVISGDSQ
jgi:hypothetical protein